MKNFILIFTVALLMTACATAEYYNYSPAVVSAENGRVTYTELILNKNGTFEEYIYWELNDSLDTENMGTVVYGNYIKRNDSLFLTYQGDRGASNKRGTKYDEVYLIQKNGLKKLAPITYSYHFLNMLLVPGKSDALRSLPGYDRITWQNGF